MDIRRFHKLFSAEEANELIPRLEILVRELQERAKRIRARISELARNDPKLAGMDLAAIVARYPELQPMASSVSEVASDIESMGCFLKDIDLGLVDFPFAAESAAASGEEGENAVAFLCWQSGERSIVAWHRIDAGFAERRPLPGAQKPLLN